jgi:catechol 2,3-dioxygenase-like lactoylglutathione lyase family enzyme
MSSLHHVAIRTEDYHRFTSFYEETFGAECPPDCGNPSVVRVGGATLHVFEVERLQPDEGTAHVGHYALELDHMASFARVRERLLAKSATDGIGIDFGEHVSLIFRDPDGFMAEILVRKAEPWDPTLPIRTPE